MHVILNTPSKIANLTMLMNTNIWITKLTGWQNSWTKYTQELYIDKNSKSGLINLKFMEAEVTEIIPVMVDAITEVEEIISKSHMIETKEDILHLEADPQVAII